MMSTPKLGLKSDSKGQAAVEALLVLMVLALVIFGGIELSRGVAIRQALDSSAGAAVRALSLDPSQWSYAKNLIQEGTNQNVMGTVEATTIQVFDAAGTPRSSAWLSGSPFGTTFILEASAPFQADIPFLSEPIMTIRVQHWGIVERYPSITP
jgi:Flp pilus assembly protein TadG